MGYLHDTANDLRQHIFRRFVRHRAHLPFHKEQAESVPLEQLDYTRLAIRGQMDANRGCVSVLWQVVTGRSPLTENAKVVTPGN
jgi:hypothetical protein